MCCSVLQCVAVCCSVLQCDAEIDLQNTGVESLLSLCNTLQHTATHCNTLQHTATYFNTPQHTATHCSYKSTHLVAYQVVFFGMVVHWQTHSPRHTLPNAATHTTTHFNALQHTATPCNTLQTVVHRQFAPGSFCLYIEHLCDKN